MPVYTRPLVKGDSGVEVRTLQMALKSAGLDPGPVDGEFGPRTRAAVAGFQSSNKISPTGMFDQPTAAILYKTPGPIMADPQPISEKPLSGLQASYAQFQKEIVLLCLEDVGARETEGKNRSKLIDGINKSIGSGMGEPYCLAGVIVRGAMRLCQTKGLKLPPKAKSAGTQDFFRTTPSKYKVLKGSKAKKGMIGILQNYADSGKGHAFMFTEDEGAVQKTVEYNTNVAGSRDGDGVYQGERTQEGTSSKKYLGAVDIVQWIIDYNS